jgi:type IV pilus assembly protein PilC
MGLEVIGVNKKLFHVQRKPPRGDMIMFVRLAANLLSDKLPFDEVLNLLVNDVSSRSLRQVIRDLNADLKGGMDAQQAFLKHQHMMGKFTAYMLGIASRSGNMAEIYESTARFLERQNEFKKSVRSAMITPAITIAVLIAAFVWYIWYIFPETARLFEGMNVALPPLTQKTLAFADWMDHNYGWVFLGLVALTGAWIMFARSDRGRFMIHRNLIRVPLVGSLFHKLNIEIFCRVFAILYSGAGDNIGVIKIAAEATGNSYIEHRIKTITVPMMVAQGTELVKAMEASGVFTSMALARFRSGSETGNVRKSALQMANYYEKETELKLKGAVESIQTAVAVFITIAICFLTIISSEIALIQPSATDMMNM